MSYESLTTVQSLRAWLKVTSDSDDPSYAALISVASEMIGRYCGRDNLGAVGTYTENYFNRGNYRLVSNETFDLPLRHWPVVSVSSVVMNGTSLQILNEATLQAYQAGVYLLEDPVDPRILKFMYLYRNGPITVNYTAGYTSSTIPAPLQQACNQLAAEIYRSEAWVMKKTVSIMGESTSMDDGGDVGMSKRVQNMLQPYRNVVPFMGWQ